MQDLSFTTDIKNNPVYLTNSKYIKSIINILFMTIPGMDEYEPTKGLDIVGKMNTAHVDNFRDIEYENEIISQFSKYTDLQVSNVVVIYKNKKLIISLDVFLGNVLYSIVTGYDSSSLEVLIK